MTLLRQLILAILTVLLLVFAGSVAINVVNTRHYLDAQLQSHAQDAATSLGLSLSTSVAEDDRATMEAMVDAMFDSGYYRSIDLVGVDGAVLLHRSQPVHMGEVPDWFVRLLPLRTPLGEAMLMSGWRQLGQVRVRSNPGYAYLELWRTTLDSVRLFAAVGLLALLLVVCGVRVLLRPLRATEAQAIAIAERQFPVQERLPRTRELRRVVQAMNHMSRKVQQMLHEQITLSEALRAQAFRDPVTGLGNRALFEHDLHHLLTAPEEHFRGVLALVQLRDFKSFNDTHGYSAGDELLRQAGEALRRACANFDPRSLARLGGADFGLLLARGEDEAIAELGAALSRALASLHDCGLMAQADVGHVGLAVHTGDETPSTLLSRADAALRAAQTQTGNAWHLAASTTGTGPRPASAWRALIEDGLHSGALSLYAQPVVRLPDGTALHHEVLVRLHSDGELLPAGGFMPMAERFGLASAIDRRVIDAVLDRLPYLPAAQCLAVNLSPSSLADAPFLLWLEDRLTAQPALAARLTFEVPEYGAARHLPALRQLAGILVRTGSGLGLDHFGRGFNPFGYLASLKLRYIKVDGRYTHALAQDSDSRFFVRTLREVAHGLDCLLIAETVEDAAQLAAVGELRMDGAQGYHLAEPQRL
ncbi:MAG: EAL domain-containing protein [Immundisolibacter sp.]